jgi:MFS family permease
MSAPTRKPTLRLFDYYVIEGISAYAATVVLMGLYFWARARFDYSNTENLGLGALQGLSHIVASRLGGRLGDRWGYNRLLVTGLSICAIATALAPFGTSRATPALLMFVYAGAIGMTWPCLEGGAMHLPGRLNTPQRLGIYNLVWSLAGATGFLLAGPLFAWRPDAMLALPALLHLGQIIWIGLRRRPGRIDPAATTPRPHRGERQSAATKRKHLHLAWLSNSLGYFVLGGFAALTPHLGERLALSAAATFALGSIPMFTRTAGFVLLWRWEGWHYRLAWGWLALGAPPLLVGAILFAPALAVVATACALLGLILGLGYYQSLYYSLDGGDRKGEQGGNHEAIIGLGILGGPLIGAAGGALTGTTTGAKQLLITAALLAATAGWRHIRRLPDA